MKIKQRLATWALFVVALFMVGSSLATAYLVAHPSKAAADLPAITDSAPLVADQYDVTNKDTKNRSNYLCTATVHAPDYLGDQAGTAASRELTQIANDLGYSNGYSNTPIQTLLSAVRGKDSSYNPTFNDVQDPQKTVLYIDFNGVNPGTENQPLCQDSMMLFRQPGSSDSTTFYGFWNTGEFVSPGSFVNSDKTVVAIKATVNVTTKSIDFFIPNGYSRTGEQTMKLLDPNGIVKAGSPYFPATGGGGSVTAGSNCLETNAASQSALDACVKGKYATIVDAATITFNGDVYTATNWGGTSDHPNTMTYSLSKPGDSNRVIANHPLPTITMDTENTGSGGARDINMDDKGDRKDLEDIDYAFKQSQVSGAHVMLTLNNVDIGGISASTGIPAIPTGLNTFATYYAKDDVVNLVFTQASNNEKPYFGTYARVAGTQKFQLAGSNWSQCQATDLAAFDFNGIDPSKPPSSYQGSSLTTATIVPATWDLYPSDQNCQVANLRVNVNINTTDNAPSLTGNVKDTGSSPQINCSVSLFNPLSWFLCPLATALEAVVSGLDNEINNYMDIKAGQGSYDVPDASKCPDQWCYYYKPWSVTRDISLALTVVFALIAIISQAFGFEILDAYTLRKVLPRLLIAIIGITLSWPLMMFFINLIGGIGLGIRGLIYAPFASINKVALGGGGQFIGSLFGVGAITALGFAGLLSFVATAALAVAVAFLVLTLRQMVITMLVIFAPIAILCYTLPNTQKVWKLWWDSFSRGLLMFPLIAAFIAIGRVFAAVNSKNAGSINQIISFTAYFAPYFLIPFTFRLAGGAIATLGGMVNDRSRGAFDRLRGYRANKTQQNLHDLGNGNRIKADNWAANAFNNTTRNAALLPKAGFNPKKMRSRMQAAGATHGLHELAEYMDKNSDFAAIKGNDDYLQATMKSMGGGANEADWRKYLAGKGYQGRSLEQGVAAIRAAKRATSDEIFNRAAVVANAATGTGWKEGGPAAMYEAINDVTHGDRQTANAMLAQMRGMAGQAGRLDLSGPGFGTSSKTMESLNNSLPGADEPTKKQLMADANATVLQNELYTKGAGEYARARGEAVKNITPHMIKRLQKAHQGVELAKGTGNQEAVEVAQRALGQEYAALANLHENLNHQSPENAQIIADTVLNQKLSPNDERTVFQQINALTSGKVTDAAGTAAVEGFQQTRRSFDRQELDAQGRVMGQPNNEQ